MPKTKQAMPRNSKKVTSVAKKVTPQSEDEREIVLPPVLDEKIEEAEVLPADPVAEEVVTEEDEDGDLDTLADTWEE